MKNSGKIKVGRRMRIVTYLPPATAGRLQLECSKSGISVAAGVAQIIHHRLITYGNNGIP